MALADQRIAVMEAELRGAQEALAAAGEELRRRPTDGDGDPCIVVWGSRRILQTGLWSIAGGAFGRKLHPDGHPDHRKQACRERFVEAEQVFDQSTGCGG